MKKWQIISIVATCVVLFGGGFWIGRISAPEVQPTDAASDSTQQTFYATIAENNGTYLLVDGLEINDINSRGRFTVPLSEETTFKWRGETISPEVLEPGDTVSITHDGNVGETYPAQLFGVIRIQLLDDET